MDRGIARFLGAALFEPDQTSLVVAESLRCRWSARAIISLIFTNPVKGNASQSPVTLKLASSSWWSTNLHCHFERGETESKGPQLLFLFTGLPSLEIPPPKILPDCVTKEASNLGIPQFMPLISRFVVHRRGARHRRLVSGSARLRPCFTREWRPIAALKRKWRTLRTPARKSQSNRCMLVLIPQLATDYFARPTGLSNGGEE